VWSPLDFAAVRPHRTAVIPAVTPGEPYREADVSRTTTRAALLLIFTYTYLANAWVGDDAYITFRTVWNFVHGFGLTFNPDERVQAYTHPLWMLVISAAHFVTREFFFTQNVVSWAFNAATIWMLIKWSNSALRAAVLVLWLISSKAFIDYSSSGLEYPLSYFLLVLFYTRFLDKPVESVPHVRELRRSVLIASLAFLNRPDAVLLYAVHLAESVWRSLRTRPWPTLGAVALAASPALVWLAFATIYYGFPLPNTYYAKVATGVPSFLVYRQGLAYVLNGISHDPITLGTIALSCVVAARGSGPRRRAALSALLYVLYTVSVGGDFMSGRFFAMPFLVAVMVISRDSGSLAPYAAGALVVYNVLVPIAPIKTTATYEAAWPWRTQNGIKDERGYYHQATNVLFFSPFRQLPDFIWVREGTSFRNSEQKVTVQGSIGFYGLYAGPSKFLVDRNALSDPFLARLPVSPRYYFEFYAGHFFRDMPDGYLDSVNADRNLVDDPLLRDFYDRIRRITRGPLFTGSRFQDILALNLGRYRNFHEVYAKRRQIALSIRADNERFITDVGERDATAGTLKAAGRSGYLEYGPGIPARRGAYRARWLGTVDDAPGGKVGFVEVWLGPDQQIARQPVVMGASMPGHLLAEIDFKLPDDVRALEYRFYVNDGVRMTLERVELYSGGAIPTD
jgi:arabinofuranosyltransferase